MAVITVQSMRSRPRALWVARLCLRYVNWAARRRSEMFIELGLPVSERMPALQVDSDFEMRTLETSGGIREFLRVFNTAYVGAPDYRKAGWVQALALQACKGYDPSMIWMAYQGGEAVGFCMARIAGRHGRITGLGVTPRWRRRGIGSGLLQQAIAELAARGAHSVDLTVAPENRDCLSLVRSLGFTVR